jgi:hypothetical protein
MAATGYEGYLWKMGAMKNGVLSRSVRGEECSVCPSKLERALQPILNDLEIALAFVTLASWPDFNVPRTSCFVCGVSAGRVVGRVVYGVSRSAKSLM